MCSCAAIRINTTGLKQELFHLLTGTFLLFNGGILGFRRGNKRWKIKERTQVCKAIHTCKWMKIDFFQIKIVVIMCSTSGLLCLISSILLIREFLILVLPVNIIDCFSTHSVIVDCNMSILSVFMIFINTLTLFISSFIVIKILLSDLYKAESKNSAKLIEENGDRNNNNDFSIP